MQTTQTLKDVLDRNARALEMRSSLGHISTATHVRWCAEDGLACDVEEGQWRLRVDMSPKSGGSGSAPNPGVYGRASLGSCLAIGYAMFAARREVPLRSICVEVQADFDARYEYGMKGRNPGYSQVRLVVTVASDEPEDRVRQMLEDANQASSFLNVWQQAQDVRLDIRYQGKEA